MQSMLQYNDVLVIETFTSTLLLVHLEGQGRVRVSVVTALKSTGKTAAQFEFVDCMFLKRQSVSLIST